MSSRRKWGEPVVVLLLSAVWFFWGTGQGQFINTETLRGLVAREMYDGAHGLIPTVHERVYLRKMPLHAWTVAALGHVVGRFDESVARWPSAALGVVYLLTVFFAARWLVDPRAGPAGAFFAGGNLEVLDYGMRADLDMGVLAFTTLAIVLMLFAWQRGGTVRTVCLTLAYAAALAGSFWKAPHVLAALWLTVIGIAIYSKRLKRPADMAFARHPLQFVLSFFCLAAIGWWLLYLSTHSSVERTSRFMLWEFLARVVPHSLSYFGELFLAVPKLVAVSLPAVAFAVVACAPAVRDRIRSMNPLWARLLVWFLPVFCFLMFVPAKAGRYWFLLVGAVALLGTAVWRMYALDELPLRAKRWCDRLVAGGLMVAGLGGIGLMTVAMLMARNTVELPGVDSRMAAQVACAASGLAMVIAVAWGLKRGRRLGFAYAAPCFAIAILALKPAQVYGFLPVRNALASDLDRIRAIDQAAPPGVTLYVLSETPDSDRAGELSDYGYYSDHTIRWPRDVDEALADGPSDVYGLVRPKALERLEKRFGAAVTRLVTVDHRDDQQITLVRIISQSSERQ